MKKILLLPAFMMLILMQGIINAQPPAPADLKARVETWKQFTQVVLQWNDQVGRPFRRIYTVYKKEGELTDTGAFVKLPYKIRMNQFIDKFVTPGKTYHYYVTANEENLESTPSDTVKVTIAATAKPGVIKGRITDEATGETIKNAQIHFIPLSGIKLERTHTDSLGNFLENVASGTYVMYFTARGYTPEFYDNTQDFLKAEKITVNEDTISVVVSLKKFQEEKYFILSGTVNDTAGNPAQARIQVLVLGRGSFHSRVIPAATDSEGKYSARVRMNDSIVVFAMPRDRNYLPEFFNNKKEFMEADRIFVTNNVSDINFVLESKPVYNNSIAGKVSDRDGKGVVSSITAFRLKSQGQPNYRKTVLTDSAGTYTFSNLQPGKYILLALPSGEYLPAFFRYDSTSTLRWKEADSIEITSTASVSNINFYVNPRPDSGFASIAGKVTDNSGAGVNGAFVYVVDENSQTIAYTSTNSEGKFKLSDLAPGRYSVVTDKVDYTGGTAPTVDLDYQNPALGNLSLSLSAGTATAVNEQHNNIIKNYSLSQNYPNPFNPATTIRYEVPQASFVSLKVYNLIGQEVAVLVNDMKQPGSYTIRFNASNLSSGIYLYKLSSGKNIITKKMVILK